ncbi:SigE family RNA polymerase sigma factor [Asanoa iriomotensis]|uniref:DNA-directed RNA polymerase sigma-70 factor n=1 Tax=Asanoa iriomotensis TaxID=234613 RepID=A0ABQ4BZ22_9ACTN|nr:SigE family RNA polymerase sigma factor [Asanoa iriomotensis]GIF55762.1 DNA-directed RNA polymerase sigma-70 factor [Asanoa iriomotensis]
MARDDRDFNEFVELRYGELLRMAYLLTGSSHDAEDLVQSALAKVMRRWHKVDDPLAYLRRTMANEQITWWHRLRSREAVGVRAPEPAVDDATDRVVQRQAVLSALRKLPARTRVVVVLRYLDDMSEAQVAALLGWPLGTVKSQSSRGLSRLRDLLGVAEPVKEKVR